jgi:hypothetical protein
VLQEVHAIHECEDHGWATDRSDPHARDQAVDIALQHPPVGISPDAAVAEVHQVLNSIGDAPSARCSEGGRQGHFLCASFFSTLLRTLPTFLTAFFTAGAERPVFLAS